MIFMQKQLLAGRQPWRSLAAAVAAIGGTLSPWLSESHAGRP